MRVLMITILLLVLTISCSIQELETNQRKVLPVSRSVSSLELHPVENIQRFLEELDFDKRERLNSSLEIYQWSDGEYVGLGHREIEWGQGEGPLSFELDRQDTILQTKMLKDFLLVRTFFGLLLKINKNGMELVQAGFPIASFEYVDGILKLYSKNGPGRFCDQEELKRPSTQRDPSCQFVGAKLVLD